MKRSKIEWCEYVWNPITGCKGDCPYCYAKSIYKRFTGDIRRNLCSAACQKEDNVYILDNPFRAESGGILSFPFGFEPTYHKYRTQFQNIGNGHNILVGSMGETFGKWIPDSIIQEIFNVCHDNDQYNYLFITKTPERYDDLDWKGYLPKADNMWYGFSYPSNGCNTFLSSHKGYHSFFCAEPLLEDLLIFDRDWPVADWIIIGAETGNRTEKIVPEKEWIERILRHSDNFGIPVFMCSSLGAVVGEENLRREIPLELHKKRLSPKLIRKNEADCFSCHLHKNKNQMITISAKSRRHENGKVLGHICKSCFIRLCQKFELELPDLSDFDGKEKMKW